jgi:GTPase SAR1 family protein
MWPSKYGGDSDDPLVVLVVGDHGSGKSSLIHWLEHGCPPKQRPRPTVGMALAVLESFGPSGEFLVELHEVGGHDAFASARGIYSHHEFMFPKFISILRICASIDT